MVKNMAARKRQRMSRINTNNVRKPPSLRPNQRHHMLRREAAAKTRKNLRLKLTASPLKRKPWKKQREIADNHIFRQIIWASAKTTVRSKLM